MLAIKSFQELHRHTSYLVYFDLINYLSKTEDIRYTKQLLLDYKPIRTWMTIKETTRWIQL